MMDKDTAELFNGVCNIIGRASIGVIASAALGAAFAAYIEHKFDKPFLKNVDTITKCAEEQACNLIFGENK